MARRPEPQWYASRGGWYVCIDGRQIRLAVGKDGKDEAWRKFHRLMLDRGEAPLPSKLKVIVLCDLLLDFIHENREQITYAWYKWHLSQFCDCFGQRIAEDISAARVRQWLSETGWGRSTRHGSITCIKRVYRWGAIKGLIASNPLSCLEGPGIKAREHVLTGVEAETLIKVADGALKDLLIILYETGMRPSEAYRIEAKDIDWDRSHAVLDRHKTRRATSRPRVIYLTPRALDILRRLAAENSTGPLLRNRSGGPWVTSDVSHRLVRLRQKLGIGPGATADAFRHLFVTDALERGVPIKTVAELAGHQSTTMIEKHYSHLHERHGYLADAVSRVRGGD